MMSVVFGARNVPPVRGVMKSYDSEAELRFNQLGMKHE